MTHDDLKEGDTLINSLTGKTVKVVKIIEELVFFECDAEIRCNTLNNLQKSGCKIEVKSLAAGTVYDIHNPCTNITQRTLILSEELTARGMNYVAIVLRKHPVIVTYDNVLNEREIKKSDCQLPCYIGER